MPLISVLMGTFNEERMMVEKSIESILAQTESDFEFIICDDGSEEVFFQWLKEYCRRDNRIILLRNEKNMGLAAVLNRCLGVARGEYVARMDADDISWYGRFEKQIHFLQENPGYAFVGSNVSMMDSHGIWGERRLEKMPGKCSFLSTSPFVHPSIMIRRKALVAVNGYDASKRSLRCEDYDLFMRLYAAGYRGYNIQKSLLYYREDFSSYKKRKYRYRIIECGVRYRGFQNLGIRKGNMRYVIKPLIVGLIPVSVMRWMHNRRFRIKAK